MKEHLDMKIERIISLIGHYRVMQKKATPRKNTELVLRIDELKERLRETLARRRNYEPDLREEIGIG